MGESGEEEAAGSLCGFSISMYDSRAQQSIDRISSISIGKMDRFRLQAVESIRKTLFTRDTYLLYGMLKRIDCEPYLYCHRLLPHLHVHTQREREKETHIHIQRRTDILLIMDTIETLNTFTTL